MAKKKTFNELAVAKPAMQDEMLSIQDGGVQLIQTDTFKRIVNEINALIPEAKEAASVDVKDLDEKQMTELSHKFATTQKYVKSINDSRKMVKNYFNWNRDYYLAAIDQLLDQAGFNEIDKYYKINKQQKQDRIAWRINQRWDQLKVTFDKNLEIYPLIKQLAPQLADFNHYRLTHEKMVSGAKTKKVNDEMRSEINNELNQWNSNLQTIQDNHEKLEPKYQQRLLSLFIENPTSDTLMNNLRILKDAQHAEEQAKAEAQQHQAPANNPQSASVVASNTPVNNATATNPVTTAPTQVTDTNASNFDPTWLVQYCFSRPKYKQIHNSNQAKAALLQEMFNQLTVANTVWNEHIGTNSDLIIEVTKYITNM